MKRLLFIIPLILTASYGFFLNSKYYIYYFEDASYPGYMPLLMALFFISSEIILWSFSSNKNTVSVLLKYGLVLFSIFATLSSQYNSTSARVLENEKVVYEKIDNSGIIEGYLEQIKIQDNRIEQIFKQRGENFLFTLTADSLEYAQAEKLKYENKIEELRTENNQDIKEVFTEKTIYYWFAVSLPEIVNSGLNEEFIRVLFQLFASLILASMSPVCITLARNMYKSELPKTPVKHRKQAVKVAKPSVIDEKQPLNNEKPEVKEIIPIPEIIPDIPEIQLSTTAVSNIILMILSGDKFLIRPDEASLKFDSMPETIEKNLHYSYEECKIVYDFIIDRKLENESKERIMEEWNNE